MAWNGSSAATSAATNKKIAKPRKASSGAPMSGAFKGTLALLVLAILGGLAYVYLTNEEVREKVKEKLPKKQITEVEADIAEHTIGADGVLVDKTSDADNVGKADIDSNEKAEDKTTFNSVFDNQADQVIAMAMDIHPGMDMPPLPPGVAYGLTKEQLKDMLGQPIQINEDDSDKVKEIKKRVIETRAEMLERIDQGEDFDAILDEHRKMVNENAAIYRECEAALRESIENGDEEIALSFRAEVNKALQTMGIHTLTVPVTADEKEAQRMERRESHRARIAERQGRKGK